jgi:transcriptional regulator with XRE-family HTH domain
MTQAELASKAGLSRGQLANIEVGRTDMPIKTLQRIAVALDCSAKELLP